MKKIEDNVELEECASPKLEERERKRTAQTYIYMTAKLRKTRVNCCTKVLYRKINFSREMRLLRKKETVEKETMIASQFARKAKTNCEFFVMYCLCIRKLVTSYIIFIFHYKNNKDNVNKYKYS